MRADCVPTNTLDGWHIVRKRSQIKPKAISGDLWRKKKVHGLVEITLLIDWMFDLGAARSLV